MYRDRSTQPTQTPADTASLPPVPRDTQHAAEQAARDVRFPPSPRSQGASRIHRLRRPRAPRRSFLHHAALSAITALGSAALLSAIGACNNDQQQPQRPAHPPTEADGDLSPHLREAKPPACKLRGVVQRFVTLSGPDRDLGPNAEGLRARLEQACASLSLTKPGSLSYVLTIAPDGAVHDIKLIDNSTGSGDFDTIMRRHLEKMVTFGADDPTKVRTVFALESK